MRYSVTLLLSIVLNPAFATETTDKAVAQTLDKAAPTPDVFEPATLEESPTSLQKTIQFPKAVLDTKVKENVVIRCDALISPTGALAYNFCLQESESQSAYIAEINRAAKISTVTPARINGAVQQVWFQYYVVFMTDAGKHSVEVMPNSGLQVDKYGFDYTSAQRYSGESDNVDAGCDFTKNITVNAVIDDKGIPVDIQVKSDNAGEKCENSLKTAFLAQKFIPAMLKGTAFRSYYSEKIFNNYREE
jgi:hypothetical protein